MTTFLIGLHIVVSIALVVIVLLQMGKGAQAGASFGAGGSQAMFGSTGGNFMSKVTVGVAITFMLTSLTLAYFYTAPSSKTMMPSSVEAPAAPASAPTPAQK